jgi:hypothetical protein
VVGISGNGFVSGAGLSGKDGSTSVGIGVATASSTGSFTQYPSSTTGGEFTVQPVTAPGPVQVTVADTQNHTASYTLNVFKASIAASTAGAVSGHLATFSGSGWPGNDPSIEIRLILGAAPNSNNSNVWNVCPAVSNSSGLIEAQSCTVPTNIAAGKYTVNAEDGSISVNGAAFLQLQPAITVTGASGTRTVNVEAGQVMGVSGTGFSPGSQLQAFFPNSSSSVNLTPAPTIQNTGTFSATTFPVPPANMISTGPATLTVQDSTKPPDVATYNVTVFDATINSSEAAGAAGSELTYSGVGWPANDTVSIKLVTKTTTTSVCNVTSDTTGSIAPQSCTVPTSLAYGAYTVNATDGSLLVIGSTFTMQPAAELTTLSGTPVVTGTNSTPIYVEGWGFAAGSTITVRIDGVVQATTPSSVVTTSLGGFPDATHFTLPTPTGMVTVTISDASGHIVSLPMNVT